SIDTHVYQLSYLFDASDAAAVLHLHLRLLNDVKQVLLIAEIALGAIQIDDMNDFRTISVVFFDLFFQRDVIRRDIVVVTLSQTVNLLVQNINCRDRKSTRLNSSHVKISYAV